VLTDVDFTGCNLVEDLWLATPDLFLAAASVGTFCNGSDFFSRNAGKVE
jgi:hypothetical protein